MIVDISKTRRRNHTLRGLGALYDTSPINPTTIWTPTTGFLNQPGNVNSHTVFGGPTSVYDVPGLLLAAPACTQDNNGAFVGAGCVDQALAVQQQNFQRTADFNAGTLQLPILGVAPKIIPPPSTAAPTSTNNQVNNQPPMIQTNQMSAPNSSGIQNVESFVSTLGSESISIGGMNISLWAIGIVAIGGFVLISGGRH
jgi:hypothetical protein